MPGMSRVYYSNSGSEANEKAFKMIRQISHRHHGGRKYKILYRERDYHGTTLATLSAGGQPSGPSSTDPWLRASSWCRIASSTGTSIPMRKATVLPLPTRSRR
jgi:adenosylmethionine-8-amino-7-oxononanoate aminotransferase